MKKIQLSIATILASAAIFLAASTALASEGTAELTSTTGSESRCFISSVLMKNSNFKIIVSCRDLIYPPATNLFSYILWANPTEGGNVIKLGELGVGKAEFTSKKAFSSLFVTSEVNAGARSASEKVVMRGNMQPLSFLEKPTKQPTITQEEIPEAEEQKSPPISTRERFLSGLKRAGLISLVALATLIGLVFFVTRSRS